MTLTEEALNGEWFYLQEEEPFDALTTTLYHLSAGEVRHAGKVVGTYSVGDGAALIEMKPTGGEERSTITLRSTAGAATRDMPALSADAECYFEGEEPFNTYGTFQRKIADYTAKPAASR